MDKDLYIELLENEMRRIRAGADVSHSLVEYQKLRERYAQCEMDLQNRDDEIQDLKLENDRLKKRDDKMRQTIRSIACETDCQYCSLRGSECSGSDMQLLAGKTLKELEEL